MNKQRGECCISLLLTIAYRLVTFAVNKSIMVTFCLLDHCHQILLGHSWLHNLDKFIRSQEPIIVCVKNSWRENKKISLSNPIIPKCFHHHIHLGLLLPLHAHHPQELIELYCVIQLVFTHRPHHGQQDAA